jgi:DNA-binding GntR family transcriptional regulator
MTSKQDTIAVRIGKALAERIIAGEIEPDSRLRQDHIAEEFGVSHVPVREAFRRLEAQGLARSEPRRGFRVASFGFDEVKEVAEMRAALEALALREAAPHLTRALLAEAELAIEAGDRSQDVTAWEEANRRFHRLIISPCGMPRLLAAIDDLHAASARFLFAAWRSDWEVRTDQEHRAILDALRVGKVELAVSRLAKHVRWVGQWPVRGPAGKLREVFALTG